MRQVWGSLRPWRRGLWGAVSICAIAAAVGTSPDADAFGSLSDGSHRPLQQRIALSVGPNQSILWTQLHVDATTGPFAMVVPASSGSAVDWSTAAWFEALEEATAPAVVPPTGADVACPGELPEPNPVHLTAEPVLGPTLSPLEVIELADADAVATWAGQHGMSASPALYTAMTQTAGPFVAVRFSGPGNPAVTPALRIARPVSDTSLPFVLSEATGTPLDVTLWTLGPGRGELDGNPAYLSPQELSFDVAEGTSNYRALREAALDGPDRWLVEAASQRQLDTPLDVNPSRSLPSVLGAYFIRGTAYETVSASASACVSQATGFFSSLTPAGRACPEADVGVVGGGAYSCSETAGPPSPSSIRCGEDQTSAVDDLAVALSEQVPANAWVTRIALRLQAGSTGVAASVSFTPGPAVDPVVKAASLDYAGCPGGGAGGGGTATTGSGATTGAGGPTGAGGGRQRQVPVYQRDTSCGSNGDVGAPLFYLWVDDSDDSPDAYYSEGDDCGGDTRDSYDEVYDPEGDGVYDDVYESDYDGADDCGGDTSESYEDETYEDDCGGDASDAYDSEEAYEEDCGGDTYDESSDDDCGGDTSDSYDSGDDCGDDTSDSGGDSCDGGESSSGEDCSVGGRGRRTRPRLSAATLALVALLFPVRRLRRPRRRQARKRAA